MIEGVAGPLPSQVEGRFEVVGAAGPTGFFARLRPETLAHGYLFTGPAGVGKRTFALRLAQSLLCVTPKSTRLGYCGHCSACTRIAAGTHPDLVVAEGQVKIGDPDVARSVTGEEVTSRDLVWQLSMHSYAGGRRIFVLADPDFTLPAANALLKFFEEPPGEVVLIVTTAAPARLLATIRSRLVEVVFASLTSAEIAAALEGDGIPAADARRVAAIAGGSLARAKVLLGSEGTARESAIEWFFATLEGRDVDAESWTRATLEEGIEVLRTLTRDWLALSLGASDPPLLAPDQATRLRALPRADPAALVRALGALADAERIARTNVRPPLVAELARMAIAPSGPHLSV